jgi:glycosyltransferase involved in cell wall biosynthesis
MGGGAGHASFQLAKTLVAKRCVVDVVTSGITGQPSCETLDGVRVFRVPSRRRSIQDCGLAGAWSYVLAAQPVVRRLVRQHPYDVIHYFFGLPTGLLALCTPGARRIPSVISLRGSDVPGYDQSNRLLGLAHAVLQPLTRLIWTQADAVIALSYALRAQALDALDQKPIGVISNAIEIAAFTPADRNGDRSTDPPTHQGGGTSDVQVLTVARLIPRKGLEHLLHAMTFLKDEPVHLTIQGGGPEGDRLQRLAVSLGIQDRISFAGFRPRHLLPGVYQAADIFVLPSLSESCGLALLEAMACGLPVVITEVGGMVEHVQDGLNGFVVPPRDPAALAAALRRLIHDAELRQAMGERNAQRIRERYTWDAVADAYLATYKRVIEARLTNGAPHAAQ